MVVKAVKGKSYKTWLHRTAVISLFIIYYLFALNYFKVPPFYQQTLSAKHNFNNTVHFIDCWQGDAAVIISKEVVTVIDVGPSKYSGNVIDYLKKINVSAIDNLIISHTHDDHFGGALPIAKKFDVSNIYINEFNRQSEEANSLKKQTTATIKTADVGEVIQAGEFQIKILGPLRKYEDLNDCSTMLLASFDKTDFLFMGDATTESEYDLVENYRNELDCEVLKVGHHGSDTSSCDEFLSYCEPDYAVISCGQENEFNHPSGSTLKKLHNIGAEVLRTDLHGNIVFKTDGETITVENNKYDVAKERNLLCKPLARILMS